MTVNINDGFLQTIASGGETTVPFDFIIYSSSDLRVIETNTSGTRRTLTEGVDYSVPGGSVGVAGGGTINLLAGVYPTGATAGYKFTCLSDFPERRSTDFQQAGDLLASTVNNQFDQLTVISQQLRRDTDKSAKLPEDSTVASVTLPTPTDDRVLAWDGTDGGMQNGPSITDISNAATNAALAQTAATTATTQATNASNSAALALAAVGAVKVTSNDTTAAVLASKLLAGTGISLTENNNGSNETLIAALDITGLTEETSIADDDLIPIYDLSGTAIKKMKKSNLVQGGLIDVRHITSNTTYTPTPGTRFIIVECWGPGGGGSRSTGANYNCAGSGGGYSIEEITSNFSSVACTIGQGGTGGATNGSAGNDGTTTSFGAFCSATGGTGGTITLVGNSTGGTGVGGDLNLTGSAGMAGTITGGSISIGGGAPRGGPARVLVGSGTAGLDGNYPGGGGTGSATGQTSGNGANGLITVWEFS
jgi:hypothetical protein